MICPHCRSVVVPLVQADGQRLCPACGNTGVVRAQPPAWGQPGAAPAGETAPGAVAGLVLGIVSFVPYVGIVTGGIAIYLGSSALRAIRAAPGRSAGEGMAQAGRILGIVALALYVVTIFLAALVLVLVSNLARNGAAP